MPNYRGRISTETVEERFSKKYIIDETTNCWEWQYATNNVGYGMFRYKPGLMMTAHKASFIINVTDIPIGMCVYHTCNNKKCVNPDHLALGDRKTMIHSKITDHGVKFGREFGFKQPLATCKHCGVTKAVTLIARNHNDKCKSKRKV